MSSFTPKNRNFRDTDVHFSIIRLASKKSGKTISDIIRTGAERYSKELLYGKKQEKKPVKKKETYIEFNKSHKPVLQEPEKPQFIEAKRTKEQQAELDNVYGFDLSCEQCGAMNVRGAKSK